MEEVNKNHVKMFHRLCSRPSTSVSIKQSTLIALKQHCFETGERSMSDFVERLLFKHLGFEEGVVLKVQAYISRHNKQADRREQDSGEPQTRLLIDEHGRLEEVKTDY
jgi:hypothetical protein